MRVAGQGTESLVASPDTEYQTLKIEGKVELGMESVPAGEKGIRLVINNGNYNSQ
jgi:hypothetical protein